MSGISSGRDQDQALHLSPDEVGNELAFALRVLCGVTEKNAPAILCGNLLDAERKVAIVGISEVRDGDTHEAARLPRPQAPRVLVAVIAERANRFEHTLLDLWPNILAARDGARNRHGAHPGQLGDFLDGRLARLTLTRMSRHGHSSSSPESVFVGPRNQPTVPRLVSGLAAHPRAVPGTPDVPLRYSHESTQMLTSGSGNDNRVEAVCPGSHDPGGGPSD